jgi:glutaredoxin 3
MKVEVFSKPSCPYCDRAKALLTKEGMAYEERSAVDERETLIERVTNETGAPPRTVPQIFIEGRHIGGYDDLVKWMAAR